MGARIPVAVLGATGTVGQRLLTLLDGHPHFEVAHLIASSRSAGRPYAEGVTWRLPGAPPAAFADHVVRAAGDPPPGDVGLALSSLDASVARDTEERYARAGIPVVSNASAHRMGPDVPLVIPEVNADHLALLDAQRERFPGGGGIACNPNCSTIGLVMALAPLHRAFGVEAVEVTTLQAASGAGYPGVPSLDLIDNVVPLIVGEEQKLVEEPAKILGRLVGQRIEGASLRVSAQCFRVPVSDGHTAAVSVRLARPADEDAVRAAWGTFADATAGPAGPVLRVTREPDRPQPRLDRDAGAGMAVTVGRLRPCSVLHWRFVVLSHNTIRGAAGGALALAAALRDAGRLGPGGA